MVLALPFEAGAGASADPLAAPFVRGAVRGLGGKQRAIEHKIFAFLVQDHEAVEPKGIAQKVDGGIRLFDDAEERFGIGNRDGAAFGAAAEVLEQELELLREFFRGGQFLGDFPGGVAGQDKPVVALSLEQDSFEDVFPQIDPKDRISASRHDAAIPCSGNRADSPVFCPWRSPWDRRNDRAGKGPLASRRKRDNRRTGGSLMISATSGGTICSQAGSPDCNFASASGG